MMSCTPYRCAQERKATRRQLCNWSGKTLALVGFEEILVSAYGDKARCKLPFDEISDILSKAVDRIEKDSKKCGICGNSKKSQMLQLSDVIDLTSTKQVSGDQPIDLSCTKLSKIPSASPSPFSGDIHGLYSSHSPRTPNGIAHKGVPSKKQHPLGGDFPLPLGDGLDQKLLHHLVNNWPKGSPLDLNSPTTSPKNTDTPGPSNAPTRSGLASHRHRQKTSALATAGSVQKTNGNVTEALLNGEPSDISSSTLSDHDAVNKFKQWRVASWVQEASRHQREGSAVTHDESASDVHVESRATNVVTNASNNTARKSPPLANVLRSVPPTNIDNSKSAIRKRNVGNNGSTTVPFKHHSTTPPVQSLHHQKSNTNYEVSPSKRIRSDNHSSPLGTSNQATSLSNLASALASIFPSNTAQTSTAPTNPASSNELDALLAIALQNWNGQSVPGAKSGNSSTSDATAALLTAAYQQQIQQAALLQLQYASIFNNPLLYSNLLLGNCDTSNSMTNLVNALGGTSNPISQDSALTEALLAVLGNSQIPSTTTHRHTPENRHSSRVPNGSSTTPNSTPSQIKTSVTTHAKSETIGSKCDPKIEDAALKASLLLASKVAEEAKHDLAKRCVKLEKVNGVNELPRLDKEQEDPHRNGKLSKAISGIDAAVMGIKKEDKSAELSTKDHGESDSSSNDSGSTACAHLNDDPSSSNALPAASHKAEIVNVQTTA